MRQKTLLIIAAAGIGLLAANDPASSQSAPRGKDRHALTQRVVRESTPLFGPPRLVREARKYIGTNPTDRKRLWCATFMNFILGNLGYSGTNSDAAKSFALYGRRISEPQVGAIAVLTRGKRGGHVGVVSGIDERGNPVIISGNHNKRVGEALYPRSRVIAYVMPVDTPSTTQLAARRNAPRATARPASRPAASEGIVSPITELLAAIEAEQARAERQTRNARPARPARSAPAARPARPQPRAVPHRVVQQSADARRSGSLDPALAEFLGLRERDEPALAARHRVATDSGLESLFGTNNAR